MTSVLTFYKQLEFEFTKAGIIILTLHYDTDDWYEWEENDPPVEIDTILETITLLQAEEFVEEELSFQEKVLPSPIGEVSYLLVRASLQRVKNLNNDNLAQFKDLLRQSKFNISQKEINDLFQQISKKLNALKFMQNQNNAPKRKLFGQTKAQEENNKS